MSIRNLENAITALKTVIDTDVWTITKILSAVDGIVFILRDNTHWKYYYSTNTIIILPHWREQFKTDS